jgi:hypothetical protein
MLGLLWRDVQRLPSPPLPPSSWRGHSKKRNSGKPWRKRASVWAALAIICLLAILVTGCVSLTSSASIVGAGASTVGAYFDYLTSEKGEAVIVTPPLVDYTSQVQSRAADEFEQLGPPCARDHLTENCSAAARFIMDYGTLRDKIRAAKK